MCKICGYTFSTAQSLAAHIDSEHPFNDRNKMNNMVLAVVATTALLTMTSPIGTGIFSQHANTASDELHCVTGSNGCY